MLAADCRVCGAPAQYVYYGTLACQPCKMFFKRNADARKDSLKCDFGGACEINVRTRHVCSACRLAKCLREGMSTEKFHASIQKKPKGKAVAVVRKRPRADKLPTLDLLESDRSSLTSIQWTLLSNLQHSYDQDKLMNIGRELVHMYAPAQPVTVEYQSRIQQFLTCIYETTGQYIRVNGDVCKLPFDDRSVVLRSAADNVSCMGCAYVMHHLNLFGLEPFFNTLQTVYGSQTLRLYLWATRLIQSDLVQFKLALALFALSENTYSFSPDAAVTFAHPLANFHVQNQYAETTWKYLVYKYGWYAAVRQFVSLTSLLIALTVFMSHATTVSTHVNDVDTLVEDTELKLILDDPNSPSTTV